MALEMDAPENLDQEGTGLREPGKYHAVVLEIDENPTTRDGKLIDNAVFRASMAVLDGTTAGQKDRQFDLVFFAPKLTHKDHGERAKQKVWFFASSIGCGSIVDGKMKLDFAEAVGRQTCMEIEMQESKYKDGQGNEKVSHNPSMAFCNVYHVDDPRCRDWPKDAIALGLLPAGLRKKPEDFDTKKPGGNGGSPTAGQTAKPAGVPSQQVTAKPDLSQSPVNLDDL
jgi:hypothetical protein